MGRSLMFVTLLYHAINRKDTTKAAIPEDMFEAQLSVLCKEGYSVISLTQAINNIESKQKASQPAVLLTFDDGFADNVLTALPRLRAFDMSATLFMVSALIGQKYPWNPQANDNIRHLTWNELQLWLEAGCDIGGHTHNHLHMTHLSADEMLDEVLCNKQILEEKLHLRLRAFSYPYGEHNKLARDVVSKHYDLAFSVHRGDWNPAIDRYTINRLEVKPDWTIEEFAQQLEAAHRTLLA